MGWEADRRPRCSSVPGVVNAASHLWRVGWGRARDPLECFPSDTPDLPCQVPPRSTLAQCRRVRPGAVPFRVGVSASPN